MTVNAPRPAPDVSFTNPQGQPVDLASLRGKTILVNLWATWCVPCRQEMPALDRLQAELGGPDFEVVALNVDTRNAERPKAWLQENGIRHLAYYADPTGKALQVLQKSGHVVGLPTTLLVDASGCEIGLLKGPAEWAFRGRDQAGAGGPGPNLTAQTPRRNAPSASGTPSSPVKAGLASRQGRSMAFLASPCPIDRKVPSARTTWTARRPSAWSMRAAILVGTSSDATAREPAP